MSIFRITISDLVDRITPPKKRSANLLAFGVGLLSAWQRIYQTFTEYKEGTSAPNWVAGTYDIYDQVIYERRVYESLVSGNTTVPDDATKWALILDSFVGVDVSQLFNCGKLQFEFALNTYFSTTFNQPPVLSDIYITNNTIDVQPFRVGAIEDTSSAAGYETSAEFVMYDYTIANLPPLFAINVPIAFYTGLGADAEQIIRNFADKYCAMSITYEIITY